MSTARFVQDPAIERLIGDETRASLERTVEPVGDCLMCGKQLGTGPLRLSAQKSELNPVVAAIHATCGGGVLPDTGVLIVPPSTWLAGAFVIDGRPPGLLNKLFNRRAYLPVIVVKPSCDVFSLTRVDGGWGDSLAYYETRGFRSFDDALAGGDTTDEKALPVTVRLARDEVSATILVDTFTSDANPRLGAGIDAAGGAFVALTAEPFPSFGHPGRVDGVMTGRTVFRWIPNGEIERV